MWLELMETRNHTFPMMSSLKKSKLPKTSKQQHTKMAEKWKKSKNQVRKNEGLLEETMRWQEDPIRGLP